MNVEMYANIDQHASRWAEQFKPDLAFTESDIEELKCHFIDLVLELHDRGLNLKAALFIASLRLGDQSSLKEEFEEVNLPVIQMRRTIFVLAGILTFFSFYFLMLFTTCTLVLSTYRMNIKPETQFTFIISFVVIFHLCFIVATIILYFFKSKYLQTGFKLRIKPIHTTYLFINVVILAVLYVWFKSMIFSRFPFGSYLYDSITTLVDYLSYSLSLTLIICFLFLFKKYYKYYDRGWNEMNSPSIKVVESAIDSEFSTNINSHKNEDYDFEAIGLDENEISKLEKYLNDGDGALSADNEPSVGYESQSSIILSILSGILGYFVVYFFLFASARIFFVIMQLLNNDSLLNIKRTWSFVMFFQFIVVLFAMSIYFLDRIIANRISKIKITPGFTSKIFITTIFFAIVDRCFIPITKNVIGQNIEYKLELIKVFTVTNYTLPLIICTSFIILFNKYYRKYMMTGF